MKRVLLTFSVLVAPMAISEEAATNRVTRSEPRYVERLIEAERSEIGRLMGRPPLRLAGKNLVGEPDALPVLVMEPIASKDLKELFPSLSSYRLISSTDILHYAQYSALVLSSNGLPSHLESDEDVASFLGHFTRQVTNQETALRIVRAFADLRSYKVVENPPDFPDARKLTEQPAPAKTDYKFLAEEQADQWQVFATFFTSDHSSSYCRYVFTIYKPPGAGIRISPPVLIRLKNYVL
jgi:hypothetical protein